MAELTVPFPTGRQGRTGSKLRVADAPEGIAQSAHPKGAMPTHPIISIARC